MSSSIVSSVIGASRKIILNRPKAMNTLNIEMCQEIKKLLTEYKDDHAVSAILMRGEGEKAFCAGGDVKNMYHAVKEKGPGIGVGLPGEPSADFFRIEYEMNFMLANSPMPQVSYWDGIVMGGGVGVSLFGDFRVATEKTLFAMPETAIGLFPDVGSSAWLPHISRGLGTYIALTGSKLKGGDLLYSGIATHAIPSSAYGDLEHAMASLPADRDAARVAIDDALKSMGDGVELPAAQLPGQAEKIERCFAGKSSVEEIIGSLEAEGDDEWAKSTLKVLNRVSPSSLKLTLQQLIRGHSLSLKECLLMEYRMSQGCMRGNDFAEGVRALLVDRDNKPLWNPSSIADVSDESINGYFDALGEHELVLPEDNTWKLKL